MGSGKGTPDRPQVTGMETFEEYVLSPRELLCCRRPGRARSAAGGLEAGGWEEKRSCQITGHYETSPVEKNQEVRHQG